MCWFDVAIMEFAFSFKGGRNQPKAQIPGGLEHFSGRVLFWSVASFGVRPFLAAEPQRLSARWGALLRCGFFLSDHRTSTHRDLIWKQKTKKTAPSSWCPPPVSPDETQRQRDCCCVTRRNLISGRTHCVCARARVSEDYNCHFFGTVFSHYWHHIQLRQPYLIMIIIIIFFLYLAFDVNCLRTSLNLRPIYGPYVPLPACLPAFIWTSY